MGNRPMHIRPGRRTRLFSKIYVVKRNRGSLLNNPAYEVVVWHQRFTGVSHTLIGKEREKFSLSMSEDDVCRGIEDMARKTEERYYLTGKIKYDFNVAVFDSRGKRDYDAGESLRKSLKGKLNGIET